MTCANVKTTIPGPKSQALIERWHRVEADTTGYQAQVVWDRGRGVVVTDVDGNTFLDWTSGVLVTNVGHAHPHLVKAICESSEKLLNNYECPTEYRVLAAEKLAAAAAADGQVLLPLDRQRDHRVGHSHHEAEDGPF